jgi:hypothetical protein
VFALTRRKRRVAVAHMYPDRIPELYHADPARRAECEVYLALLESLSDEYSVFAWVSWVMRRPGEGARDGEADFVIAHPGHGILVLEVKGGAIAYDAGTGAWSTTDRNGHVHALREGPFAQARRHRYDLARKLADTPGWAAGDARFGYAVAFPDSAPPDGDLGLDAPSALMLCRDSLGRLDERIAAIGQYWQRSESAGGPPGAAGVEALRKVLAQSFKLRMPLGCCAEEDARRLVELSEAQYGVLDGLSRNRRMLVTGGAGTGKTLLALEKAKRLARDDGFRTLLTCFNRPLAEYLKASAGEVPNLTVLNFHELCATFARRAGAPVQAPVPYDLPNEFYRESLPAMLVDALAQLPDRFEAIVLDEAQDFSATDRAALELALDDRSHSVLYVFQDETQAIYREGSAWPEAGMSTYVLTENRRNTREIHAVLGRLAGETRTKAIGPQGAPSEFVLARDAQAQARELSRVLHRLIREQGVAPGAIAVLTSSRRAVPDLVEGGRIGAFEVTTEHDAAGDRVLVESVTRFKGLERDVVILVRLDPVAYCEYAPLLYVGASRARAVLVVIGGKDVLRRFRDDGPEAGTVDGVAASGAGA